MMYITIDHIRKAIPETTLAQLTDDEGYGADINVERVDEAILYATNTVNGYLVQRYSIPLAKTSSMVNGYAVDIARHWLYMRRPEGDEDLPKAVVRMYKNALEMLKAVRDGKSSIIFDDGTQDSGSASGGDSQSPTESSKMAVQAPNRVFDDETLSKY